MPLVLEALDWLWYVPEFGGNRARFLSGEDLEPMAVELRPPGAGEIFSLTDMGGGLDRGRLFLTHVRAIRHLQLADGTVIPTGDRLWEISVGENRLPAGLVIELLQALDDAARRDAGRMERLTPAR